MNTALIFAGGTGQRMNSRSKPKQFLEMHGKPIILYTLERFEEHPEIDNIVVVCLESWINQLNTVINRYDIKKVQLITPGGDTGHESIYNGLKALEGVCRPDDIILIHDGVRPMVTRELITANINTVRKYGTAITAEPATESIISSENGDLINSVPPRNSMFTAKAPQSFYYGLIWDLYQKARHDGLLTVDSAHLLSIYGKEMHMVKSSSYNIKITTPADYYIFRALYEAMENQQIFGL